MNSAVLGAGQRQRGWTQALVSLAAVLVALVLIFWGTATTMVTIWWRSETFTHAFIVPPMVIWLAWRRRAQLLQMTPSPTWWILVPLAVVAMAWLLGQLVAVNALTQLTLVAMMVLAVPAVLGIEIALALAFPLCFAFFAVPIGEFALPALMQWTADFTVGALRLSGVPVFREGLRFVIPSGSWSVVEACSGVRYLIASFMVGSLYAYLNYQSNKRRWIFVGLSLLVPIVANWIRAYLIVMLGHLSNNKIATGVDHIVYGWVFFGIVIMAMFTIGARWAEPEPADPALPRDPANTASGRPATSMQGMIWLAAGSATAIALLPVLLLGRLDDMRRAPLQVRLALPETTPSGWRSNVGEGLVWAPAFQNPSATASRIYAATTGSTVGVHLLYYQQQREGSKVVSSSNYIVRADDFAWNTLSVSSRMVAGATDGGNAVVRETVLVDSEQTGRAVRTRIKVWQVYWIDGAWTVSEIETKLRLAWNRLNGRGEDAAAVVLYAPDGQPGGAEVALTAFWRDNERALQASLATARVGQP